MKVRAHKIYDSDKDVFIENSLFEFRCPGCEHLHSIPVIVSRFYSSVWIFNGDLNKPTFSPSILNRWGKYVDPNYNDEDTDSGICHCFVTDGKIQFLGDCTHKLSGQTVELPEID
jgi:hypothetical protein